MGASDGRGTPGLEFAWEIKAKQKDTDQLRLEPADELFDIREYYVDYGQEAADYIEELMEGRVV